MSRSISITECRLAWGLGEAAESIGVSKRFLWNEIRRGKLEAIKRGRRILIHADALDRYLRDEGGTAQGAIANNKKAGDLQSAAKEERA